MTLKEEGYSTHLLTDETIRVIKSKKDKPLFIELCYAAPHLPNEAPDETVANYQHIENKNRQLHAAMVTEVDKGIQRIYEALEKEGLLDNTIIWLLSDNGGLNMESLPESVVEPTLQLADFWGTPLPFPFLEFVRDNIVNGGSDNSPLRKGKNSVYEGGIRVPAFIYAPKYLPSQQINHRVTVNDILPTLATATRFTSFDMTNVDGVSQWQFLRQKAEASTTPYVAVARYGQAYFKDDWKLVVPNEGTAELYNIKEDATESKNLATQYPEIVDNLKSALFAFPRGESVDDPLWKVFVDPDLFGGTIDRPPYAGKEGKVSGPLHQSFYILGFIVLGLIALCFWLIRLIIRRIRKYGKR